MVWPRSHMSSDIFGISRTTTTIRSYTGVWELMSRGSFAGPEGTHTRWQIPSLNGSSAPAPHTTRLKLKQDFYTDDQYTRVDEAKDLIVNGPVFETIVAREVPTAGQWGIGYGVNSLMIDMTAAGKDLEAAENSITANDAAVAALEEQVGRSEELIVTLTEKLTDAKNRIEENRVSADALGGDIGELEKERKRVIEENLAFEKEQTEIRDRLRECNRQRETVLRDYTKAENLREQLKNDNDRLAAKIWDDYELTYTAATELGCPAVTEETRPSFGARQTELRNRLRALGSVNVGAIDEYNDVKQRYDFSKGQYDDLCKARESLDGIIGRLEREMKTRFVTAVDEINRNFKVTFRELFGGGSAEISLTDPENVLTSGIDINVAPPGKII